MTPHPPHVTLVKNIAQEVLLTLALGRPGPVVPRPRARLRSWFACLHLAVDLLAIAETPDQQDETGGDSRPRWGE